jgi:hypothetical protein
VGKSIVMRCSDEPSVAKDSGKRPCAICSKGVGSNSVHCAKCKMWVHTKCSVVKGRLKVDRNFQCKKCIVNFHLELQWERRGIYCWKTVNQLSALSNFAIPSCGDGAGEVS